MDLKTEGKKFILKEKLEKVKKDHEKALAAKERDEQAENAGINFEFLKRKSTVIF
jgi:hypothetical protein